ncbi:MAG: YhjD/YihY/BrkB family envelope integrity protein [Thermoanaerobaculia bacterium]
MSGARNFVAFVRVILHRTVRGFFDAHGYDLAAGLAYVSLITFVPLVASVTVLTFTLFGDTGAGLYSLMRAILPATTPQLLEELRSFSSHAQELSRWATFLFLLTSLRMFLLVEGAANALWGSEMKRRPLIRLGTGLTVVLLGPIAVGILTSLLIQSGASVGELRFSGVLVSAGILTLLYRFVPSAYVRWLPAAVAGCFAALGLGLLKVVFTKGVILLNEMSHIYGPISAIVIFVLAIGLVWDLLLLGVSLAHAIQFRHELLAHDEPERAAGKSGPLDEAVRMLLLLARPWPKRIRPVEIETLARAIGRPPEETRLRLDMLVSAGLVIPCGDDACRLARRPEEISLYTVARAVGETVPRAIPMGDDPADATLRRVYRKADREVRGVLQGTSLRDLALLPEHPEAAAAHPEAENSKTPLTLQKD